MRLLWSKISFNKNFLLRVSYKKPKVLHTTKMYVFLILIKYGLAKISGIHQWSSLLMYELLFNARSQGYNIKQQRTTGDKETAKDRIFLRFKEL